MKQGQYTYYMRCWLSYMRCSQSCRHYPFPISMLHPGGVDHNTYCYTRKFNTVFSLYRVLEVTLYFFKNFPETAIDGSISSYWNTIVFGSNCGLLFRIQVVFETFLILITSRLAIVSQLIEEIHLQWIRLFFRSGGQLVKRKWFGK